MLILLFWIAFALSVWGVVKGIQQIFRRRTKRRAIEREWEAMKGENSDVESHLIDDSD